MTMRRGERLSILTIILITGSVCYFVFSALWGHAKAEELPASWQPPTIEKCDLPLWERIRRNCP